jgi:hypothetical protein
MIFVKNKLRNIYDSVPYLSIKYESYFSTYEELLKNYVGRPVTFVEVGVFNGGSLFMWREYLGPEARIIGIDLNPGAKSWEKHGFEIYIGDQASEDFWKNFFNDVGPVDVLIDDGGHTNRQQITTVDCAIENIRNGGVLIVEDVHTSYFREFGNPWSRSFIKFTARIVDSINSRASALKSNGPKYSERVHKVSYFESIVAFHVDTNMCAKCKPTTNNGLTQKASDFRYQGAIQSALFSLKNNVTINRFLSGGMLGKIILRLIDLALSSLSRLELVHYLKYWSRAGK